MAIINPKNLSFSQILSDLQAFVKSKVADASSPYAGWKDFFASSAGQTILELMAAMGTYDSYHSMAARRETDLDSSLLLSSKMSFATVLGYPVNRKSAPALTLSIDFGADYTPIPLYKGAVIGYYGERPLCLVGDYPLGISPTSAPTEEFPYGLATVPVLVGSWETKELTVGSTGNQPKDFFTWHILDETIDNGFELSGADSGRVTLTINKGEPGARSLTLVRFAEELAGLTPGSSPSNFAYIRTVSDGVLIVFGNDTTPSSEAPNYYTYTAFCLDPSIVTASPEEGGFSLDPNSRLPYTAVIYSATLISQLSAAMFEGRWESASSSEGGFGYRVRQGDVLTLDHVSTTGPLTASSPALGDFNMNVGTVTSCVVDSSGSLGDTEEKLRSMLPGYHAAQRRLITLNDYKHVMLGWSGAIISAGAVKVDSDDECSCTVQVYPLLAPIDPEDPYGIPPAITPAQSADLLEYLDQFKVLGSNLIVGSPTRVNLAVTMTVVVGSQVDGDALTAYIRDEIIKSKVHKLGVPFVMGTVLSEVNDLPDVQRVYLQRPTSDYVPLATEYLHLSSFTLTIVKDPEAVLSLPILDGGYGG